jgi:Fe2+ transport system protein FeoA
VTNFNPWLTLLVGTILGLSTLAVLVTARGGRAGHLAADERAADLLAAGLLPLADCPRGRDACLRCLLVERCVAHRLLELGLTPGTELRVVQDSGGPMVVSVRGSRVALGRDLAERLWVEVERPAADINYLPAHALRDR